MLLCLVPHQRLYPAHHSPMQTCPSRGKSEHCNHWLNKTPKTWKNCLRCGQVRVPVTARCELIPSSQARAAPSHRFRELFFLFPRPTCSYHKRARPIKKHILLPLLKHRLIHLGMSQNYMQLLIQHPPYSCHHESCGIALITSNRRPFRSSSTLAPAQIFGQG